MTTTLSAEQEKFEKTFKNTEGNIHSYSDFCVVRDFLLASNQRVRLQTLQEVQGMIEGEKVHCIGVYEPALVALSAISAKLSAKIEQEK